MQAEDAALVLRVAMSKIDWDYRLDYENAFETAFQALEKQTPKSMLNKPVNREKSGLNEMAITDRFYCPRCGEYLGNVNIPDERQDNYCPYCGQNLERWQG